MSKIALVCVDDEQTILESLKIQLEIALEGDYRIEIAQDGEEALEVLEELIAENYDVPVIIVDYIMPGLRGDELLKRIHSLYPQIMKIMLTGQADVVGITNAINQGNLYRYIAKPWQVEDLKLTIEGDNKS
jgi:DNA-binding NtrC family response regulator